MRLAGATGRGSRLSSAPPVSTGYGRACRARHAAGRHPPHQLGAVAAFLKLQARRGETDFSAETIAAAMHGSGYSVELIGELLAELKAAGHFDRILVEAAAAEPAD
jgi:hypothetical protein